MRARAESLGRAGRQLERCAAQYHALKAELGQVPSEEERRRLAAAWELVLRAREVLIVLREANGIHRHEAVDAEYGLPLPPAEFAASTPKGQ